MILKNALTGVTLDILESAREIFTLCVEVRFFLLLV